MAGREECVVDARKMKIEVKSCLVVTSPQDRMTAFCTQVKEGFLKVKVDKCKYCVQLNTVDV